MDYREEFVVKPKARIKLDKFDPAFVGKHVSEEDALVNLQGHCDDLRKLQALLYAEKRHSLLIVLQGLDAAGKDGTVNHVMGSMNPQGTAVTSFKVPTAQDLDHDFLWRVHPHAPAKGHVAIFNRSHYEDVLVPRVHKLVPRKVWSERYDFINAFEKLLRRQNNTRIVKFFLHISKQEQLARFKQRLDDPARNWKISEGDYKERELWDDYTRAFEDAFAETSRKDAPWYIIPSNHKWFRDLAVSQIVAATLKDLGMQMPMPQVALQVILKQYHQAAKDESNKKRREKDKQK